jgi:hypothetical protein
MSRNASLLPRASILLGLVAVCLYAIAPSSAEAMAPALSVAAFAWSNADPSLAPLAILAAGLGSAGFALRFRQRRSG